MTVKEHNTCKHFRLNKNYGNNYNDNNYEDLYGKRRMRFKPRKKNVNYDYGNFNFIIGFSAVVERLWLMVNKLLYVNQSIKYPLLMESLFFYNQNRRYWDIGVVQKAQQVTFTASVKNNMAENE